MGILWSLNARRDYQNLISQSDNQMIPVHFFVKNPNVEGRDKLLLFICECLWIMDQVYVDKNALICIEFVTAEDSDQP